MHLSFCGNCGSGLCKTVEDEKFQNMIICFMGTLEDDGELLKQAPQAEIWTKYRVDWATRVGGGEMMQYEGFP